MSEQNQNKRHATVLKDGYEVPLIGIPPDATDDICESCKRKFHLSKLIWTGKQLLCSECAS